MTYTIYALLDPRDSDVRYVGATSRTPEKRLVEHLLPSYSVNNPKNAWIKKLRRMGLTPVVRVLQKVDEHHWQSCETYWISYFRASGVLLNSTLGGDGVVGRPHTEEEKRKVSEALKGIKRSVETRRRMSMASTGNTHDASTREKMSLAKKGKPGHPWTEEALAKVRGQKRSDEAKAKMRRPRSEEHRRRISEAKRRYWAEKKAG